MLTFKTPKAAMAVRANIAAAKLERRLPLKLPLIQMTPQA